MRQLFAGSPSSPAPIDLDDIPAGAGVGANAPQMTDSEADDSTTTEARQHTAEGLGRHDCPGLNKRFATAGPSPRAHRRRRSLDSLAIMR